MLAGLSALVRFRLDKVVYLISGSDPRKPSMISAEIRHFMGKEVLKMFAPLFGYSSSAMGSNDDGETNMFKMLALNPEQRIDAFYIVGADHYHRINPKTGGADTIQKIEEHLARNTGNFNDAFHSVSIIFIERGARSHSVETDLPVSVHSRDAVCRIIDHDTGSISRETRDQDSCAHALCCIQMCSGTWFVRL